MTGRDSTSASTCNSTWQATNAPSLKSWVASANRADSDFPIQNLPFGIFSDATKLARRVGVAIGDFVLDIAVLAEQGLISLPASAFAQSSLNAFISLGQDQWRSLRVQLSALLKDENATLRDNVTLRTRALVARADATLHLPVIIPGYTDFYSSKEHATNVGSMFRDPKNALLPNWLEMPIGYNGRASSVVVSGTAIKRPCGQIKLAGGERPIFGACRKLDIELETGFIVGAETSLGDPIRCEKRKPKSLGWYC